MAERPAARAQANDTQRQSPEFDGDRAFRYDRYFDAPGGHGHVLRARMEKVLELLGHGPGEILDAGMGPGRLGVELDRRGWTFSGVDPSPEMVHMARQRLPHRREALLESPAEELPFPDESFDVAIATGVVEYTDLPRALAELRRVVRPGGRVVVSYPNPHAQYNVLKVGGYYPLVRLGKRLLSRPDPSRPTGHAPISPEDFEWRLARACLDPVGRHHVSFLGVPAPLDTLLPGLSGWVARRLERRHMASRLLATQIVYLCRVAAQAAAIGARRTS